MQFKITATYRIQFRPEFDFDSAAELAPYMEHLGISHVYSSPYLQAAPGSTHGYDVVNHGKVNEELGGEKGFEWFCRSLGKHNLGQILDIVPNHMAITGPENEWWWDVLENGPSSQYASYFDVDWDLPAGHGDSKVLLPILGNHYGRILEAGELILERREGSFFIRYFDNIYPVAPRSLSGFLAGVGRTAGSPDLEFIASALEFLPLPTAVDRFSTRQRHRDKEVIRQQLARLLEEQPAVRRLLDEELGKVNADVDRLDMILEMQNYRLAYWRMARTDLGYRRFFDINSLAALRTEDEDVFSDTHRLVIEWLENGILDGVRVDHPDGLRDPETYFSRLRSHAEKAWIVAEKILEHGERLRKSWKISGTTGYDFLNLAGNLFVLSENESPLTDFYREFTGETRSFPEILYRSKHQVLRDLLGSDINRLTELAVSICYHHRRHRDYSRQELKTGISEIAANFDVYRTYISGKPLNREDQQIISRAVARAKQAREDIDPELFDFFQDILLLKIEGPEEYEFVMRLQQITGPVMAKGAEDTAFYIYNRFNALNEVGGDPGHFGISADEFHKEMDFLAAEYPHTMLASTTHDTKRCEDVRSRLYCLSEIPRQWKNFVTEAASLTEKYKSEGLPDRNTEYLLYQTLTGAWPITPERTEEYMLKAVKEAKAHTSWVNRNEEYEQALKSFIQSIFGDESFTGLLENFVGTVQKPGFINSLSLTLIKLTCPGIPDIYQGCELPSRCLVDPDNRRPVDFGIRREILEKIEAYNAEEVMKHWDKGWPKLYLIRKVLLYRRKNPGLFSEESSYIPVGINGRPETGILGYIRKKGKKQCLTAVPRFNLSGGKEACLSLKTETHWRNVLTGEDLSGSELSRDMLFKKFPVAFLTAGR
ncbi:MAG: malto-oligosyltrehalose synthase [Spirochaetia bacterium]